MSNYVLTQERNKIFSTHHLRVLVFTVRSVSWMTGIAMKQDVETLKLTPTTETLQNDVN